VTVDEPPAINSRVVGKPEANPHEYIVAVPSLWPRPGGVLQQHGLGVLRPSGGANAVTGCWPTCQEQSPTCRFRDGVTSECKAEHIVLFG
jgi:hypothetical protein